jgi:hypothetical protein
MILSVMLFLVLLAPLPLTAQGAKIYTRANASSEPAMEDVALEPNVSQYGITWTFDKPARVGRFVNGDWYVIGATTVVEIAPKALVGTDVPDGERGTSWPEKDVPPGKLVRNGSMLNPPAKSDGGTAWKYQVPGVAYDSGIGEWYRFEGLSLPPIQMKPGDSLVSTISLKKGEEVPTVPYGEIGKRWAGDYSPLKVAAILTCVEKPLPPDAFRPGYLDRKAKTYFARDLRRELLPKLPLLGKMESGNVKYIGPNNTPDPVKFAEIFQKPWIDVTFFGWDHPLENLPNYGQQLGQVTSDAGVMLCLDYPPEQKEPLLINFVQVGIDYWSQIRAGYPGWKATGGHGSGRKFPIVFAGFMLGDEEMASPTKAFPKAEFGEDNQTRYGNCWTGAKVVWAGHEGFSSATGKPWSPGGPTAPYEHLRPAQWKQQYPDADKDFSMFFPETYRRANTSVCWVGEALAMRLLKLEKQWNHDPFFDYVDRWMFEENDKDQREEIAKAFPKYKEIYGADGAKGEWMFEGNAGPWIGPYWKKYRTMEGMPPTDGWKKLKDGPRVPPEIENATTKAAP